MKGTVTMSDHPLPPSDSKGVSPDGLGPVQPDQSRATILSTGPPMMTLLYPRPTIVPR